MITSCSKTNSSSGGDGGVTPEESKIEDFVVQGQLAIDTNLISAEDAEVRLSQRKIEIYDDQNVPLLTSQTGDDGSYTFNVPGALAINVDSEDGEADTALSLVKNNKLFVRTIIKDSPSGSVVGLEKKLHILSIKDRKLELGTTPLEKLTAIRGKVLLEGASDSSGILVYVPGTSYTAFTDSSGQFVMTNIPEGTHELKFEKDGYDPYEPAPASVVSKETTDIGENKLYLSGGATGFSVVQNGDEGFSKTLNVEFKITPGKADRMKVGLESELASKEYAAIPETYSHAFTAEGEFELVFAFATRDGFESTITKRVLVDATLPDASKLSLVDVTSLSATHTNSLNALILGSDCDDIYRVAIQESSNDAPVSEDFKWSCSLLYTESTVLPSLPNGSSFDYKLWAMDRVGNISEVSSDGSLTIDLAAPTAPAFTLADSVTTNSSIASSETLTVTISDCTEVDFVLIGESLSTLPNENAGFIPCSTTPFTYTLTSTSVGTKSIYLWAKDLSGNVSPTSEIQSIVFDNRLPGIPAFTISDATSGSLQYTNDVNVKLTVSTCSNIDKIAFGESLTTAPSLASFTQNCSTAVEALDYAFTDATPGSKTVYMWGLSVSGVVSVAAETAFITLKTSAPSVPSVTIIDPETLSTSYLKTPSASASIGDCTGISKVMISFSQSTQPSESAILSNCSTAANAYSLSLGATPSQGNHTPYVWIKDEAGNIDGGALTDITYDSMAPSPPTLTLTDQTSGSTAGSDITTVNATVGDCTDISKIIISESQVSKPVYSDFVSNCNDAPNAFTHTFANNIAGPKTVLLWAIDAAGNISNTSQSSTMTYDNTPPSAPSSMTLSDPTPANTGYSNSLTLDVTLSACADTTHVLISETQSTQPSETDGSFVSCSTSGIQVSAAGAGSRTFYVWSRDVGGNVSATSQTASIQVDLTAPVPPNLTLKDQSNSSTTYTNTLNIDIEISSCSDADQVLLNESGTVPAEGDFSSSCSLSGLTFTLGNTTNETKTVYLHVKDLAGNISSTPASSTIYLDTAAPSLPATLAIVDSTNASATYTNSLTFDYTIASCTAGTSILLKEGQSTAPSENDGAWFSCATTGTASFTSGSQGSKTTYLWVKDEAGNISVTSLSDSLTYDSSAPSSPSFSLEDDDDSSASGYTNSLTTDITLSAGTCSDVVKVYFSTSASTPSEGSFSLNCDESADFYQFSFTGTEGTKTVYAWGIDTAGNISSSHSENIYYDTSTPSISNVYVTELGTDKIVVGWTTSENVPTDLSWGTSFGSYPTQIGPTGSTTSHSVTISSLAAYTTYYFRVSANDYAEHSGTAVESHAKTIKISKIFHETSLTKFARMALNSNEAAGAHPMEGCDINDDGKDDLFVANPGASVDSHTQNGAVYVYFGQSSTFTYNIPTTNSPDIEYYGEINSQYVGKSLHCGDFNGDGKDDIYIGSNSTKSYLIIGGSSVSTGLLDLASSSNYDVLFSDASSTSAIAFGNVNNDSYDDLVICHRGGKCYGHLGSASPDGVADFDMDYSASSGFGYNVTLSNIDGDTYNDIVIGTWDHNGIDGSTSSTGALHIKKGETSLSGSYTTPDYAIFPNFGARISPAVGGDFDGDGFGDLVTRHYSYSASNSWLFHGFSAAGWSSLTVADNYEFGSSELNYFSSHQVGIDGDDFFHTGYRAVIDFDNDGKDDLLLSDISFDSSRGKTCLYKGRSQAAWDGVGSEVTATEADFCINGADIGDRSGFNVLFLDIDGDGKQEIVTNAIDGDGPTDGTLSAGELAIIYMDLPPLYQNMQIELGPHF